jgi:hypothetical protein
MSQTEHITAQSVALASLEFYMYSTRLASCLDVWTPSGPSVQPLPVATPATTGQDAYTLAWPSYHGSPACCIDIVMIVSIRYQVVYMTVDYLVIRW